MVIVYKVFVRGLPPRRSTCCGSPLHRGDSARVFVYGPDMRVIASIVTAGSSVFFMACGSPKPTAPTSAPPEPPPSVAPPTEPADASAPSEVVAASVAPEPDTIAPVDAVPAAPDAGPVAITPRPITDWDEPPEAGPPPVQAPLTIASYTAPSALGPSERSKRFPRGDRAAAREANKKGLALRASGDHAGARAAYQEGVTASPSHVAVRYNLACELALDPAAHDLAIAQLEELLRVGTPEARAFVSRARFDVDFAALHDDARFQAIVGSVHYDPAEPFGPQLCNDPGRIGSLIDPDKGYYDSVDQEAGADESPASFVAGVVQGKAAYDAALSQTRALGSYLCGGWEDPSGSLVSFKLANATKRDTVCMAFDAQGEWATQFLVCVANQPEGWRLASMAEFPTGPIGEEAMLAYRNNARAARDRGLALFGKTFTSP